MFNSYETEGVGKNKNKYSDSSINTELHVKW